MLDDEQIRALKTRSETHNDLWMRDGRGGCSRVVGVNLQWAESKADPADAVAAVLLGNSRVVPVPYAHLSDFVTLKPWDGSSEPTQTDKLTMLQDAARGGLDVNFMTGMVQLPKHLMPSDGAA